MEGEAECGKGMAVPAVRDEVRRRALAARVRGLVFERPAGAPSVRQRTASVAVVRGMCERRRRLLLSLLSYYNGVVYRAKRV